MTMDVHIAGIKGHGDADEELVMIFVDNDCDIGDYLLSDTTYTAAGKVSNKLRHVFWFPDQKVRSGDVVVLRTGKGKNAVVAEGKDNKRYRYYWQLGSPVWNNDGDAAVLLKASEWRHRKVGSSS